MLGNYEIISILVFINIINFIIYNYLEYKQHIKEKFIDLIFNPLYTIWVSIYLNSKKLKRNVNDIIKLSFFISYYLFIILLINIVFENQYLLFMILLVILGNFINILIIKKKINNKISFEQIDYLLPIYIISIYYYCYISESKGDNILYRWIIISKTFFNLYLIFLLHIVYNIFVLIYNI